MAFPSECTWRRGWGSSGCRLGKQRLYVIPERNMIVVRFCENAPKGQSFLNTKFLGLVLGLKPKAEPNGP